MAAVDATFSEPVELTFIRNGEIDGDRYGPTEIAGVLRVLPRMDAASPSSDFRPQGHLRASRAELHIDAAKFPNVAVRVNDLVRAIARPGNPLFEVFDVHRRSHTRLVLLLNEA